MPSFVIFNAGFTKQNFQKIDIVNFIKNKFTDLQYELVNNINDPRDYKVSFDKINKFLSLNDPVSLTQGIDQIVDLYNKKEITDKDFSNFNLDSVIKFFSS